jgi:hypothetical protein
MMLGLVGLRGVHRCRQPSARVGGSSARFGLAQSPQRPGWSQPMPALARPSWRSIWVEGDRRGPPARRFPARVADEPAAGRVPSQVDAIRG